jgi:glucokinase
MAFIGIDKGGTRHTLALADDAGAVQRHVQHGTDRAAGAEAELASLRADIDALMAEAAALGSPVRAIGISFGGPVDTEAGTTILSHHVAGWENLPLRDLAQGWSGVPVALDNDANVGALGEWAFGAGMGVRDLVYVNVGTGIGGGVIANGKLVRGAGSLAGEIGHMTIDPAGPPCTCDRTGCLEAFAAGPGIERRYRERTGTARSGREIFARALEGDADAARVVADTADYLARGIGAAVCLLNPARVVLGGGLCEAGAQLFDPLNAALARYVLPQERDIRVVPALLGYDAGVRGAVALAMEAAG